MSKITLSSVPLRKGSSYPAPFHHIANERIKQALGDAGELSDFGVNLTQLPPGAWSSQRHWHTKEDEFVYVISGELTLINDNGETLLRAGDCAAFPKNVANGHHFINKGSEPACYLEVGTRIADDVCHYPDIDLHYENDLFTHKDGSLYPQTTR